MTYAVGMAANLQTKCKTVMGNGCKVYIPPPQSWTTKKTYSFWCWECIWTWKNKLWVGHTVANALYYWGEKTVAYELHSQAGFNHTLTRAGQVNAVKVFCKSIVTRLVVLWYIMSWNLHAIGIHQYWIIVNWWQLIANILFWLFLFKTMLLAIHLQF